MTPTISRALARAKDYWRLSPPAVDDLIRRYADVKDESDLPAWIRDIGDDER